ncbi:MAG: M1 family aminopeptidase [Flavobacteriales bacterium]
MKLRYFLALTATALMVYSCGNSKNIANLEIVEEEIPTVEIELDDIVIEPDTRSYRATEARIHDLKHMNLSVSFDWEKRSVLGKTELTLSPYFYASNKLVLDAKGMKIASVSVKNGNNTEALEHTYDNEYLTINLNKEYTKDEAYTIEIIYEAFPERMDSEGSSAITMAQGIYFINPDSAEVDKPTQIWTQGETEANSVWFPTIDSPNERMTQEIQVTINEKYKTLSNGELLFSNYNPDGTRTDYWKQELPHAPYLVMLAIGDFQIVSDSWVNAENEELVVDYYMEPEYAPYARDIFGNTPEMLSFYSEVLGYPYPWDKYSQVIVRDFVSGAMENTSAVIHGDFLNATDRDLLDGDNESIIAHELFHHWFGDLVTCESWSNLPLNESFATYGEYLWMEHKYGRDAADLHGLNSMNGYLAESQTKQEDLIRFYYDDKEDMFDGHSYNKGGRVLHMLRYFLGDEAFFAGLKLYLEDNEFEAVEIHQLRLAMEEISGKDLNWFFNQWFLGSGHPDLIINYTITDSLNTVGVTIEQTQDKLFRLPLYAEVVTESGSYRTRLDIRKRSETFRLDTRGEQLLYINVDADKVLLGTKKNNLPAEWLKPLYENGSLFLDRSEALEAAMKDLSSDSQALIKQALADDFWKIKHTALSGVRKLDGDLMDIKPILENLAASDPKSAVRAKALRTLTNTYRDQDYSDLISKSLEDRSYSVMAEALQLLVDSDVEKGMAKAKSLETETSPKLTGALAKIYAKEGKASEHEFFKEALARSGGFSKYSLLGTYSRYLNNQDDALITEGVSVLEDIAANDNTWWVRASAYGGLLSVLDKAEEGVTEAVSEKSNLAKFVRERIDALVAKETNPQILGMMAEY